MLRENHNTKINVCQLHNKGVFRLVEGKEYQTLRQAIVLQKICCSQSPQAVPACPCAKGRTDRDAVLGSREVRLIGRARSEYVADEKN